MFYSMVAILVAWAGYAAIQAGRNAGKFSPAGPQETAELFVREHLQLEMSEQGLLHFHNASETQVEKIGANRYRVTGAVDVIQSNGSAREDRYFCTIRQLADGEWAAERIYVLPTS